MINKTLSAQYLRLLTRCLSAARSIQTARPQTSVVHRACAHGARAQTPSQAWSPGYGAPVAGGRCGPQSGAKAPSLAPAQTPHWHLFPAEHIKY
ncbi:hypothetical protein DPMN_163051 [Dreissena polymorpha]|uniref:Uncharacterized protein n=1 Tax=Dreissena polymorpha TaxID=45954 RepID=A0A9D4EV23_DREPO|nr:hypothetical protein DPMN_163051 [Dreissena polymorpha]